MAPDIQREAVQPLASRRTMGPLFQISPGCAGDVCLIITIWPNGGVVTFTNVMGLSTFNIGGFVNM